VRSLFGGVGGAISSVMMSSNPNEGNRSGSQDRDKDEQGSEPNPTATSTFTGLNLFGSSGRPPFVMNTAVDESFDDQPTPPVEEEEELGWDDEEEGDGGDEEDEDQVEEIEFKEDEKEQLEKLLTQAISERDSLHEMVELQRNEIATLKLVGVGSNDMEQLKMQLFEKNAELAALKASLEDTYDDDDDDNSPTSNKKDATKTALQERELERLSNELSEREIELLELKQQWRKRKPTWKNK